MKHSEIQNHEKRLRETGLNGAFALEKFSIDIPNESSLKLDGYVCRPKHSGGYYYKEKDKKERICLHFTAGHIVGDIYTLTRQNYHVSVPFLIARDGSTYQLHSSAHWSYHLGRDAIGGNEAQSRVAIGIEISNYGWLDYVDGHLETPYSKPGKKDIYCSELETDKYIRLEEPYRGKRYFATFTDEQYESIIILLRYLTATYDIPREFLAEDKRFEATKEVLNFKGIVSHVNYRGKNFWGNFEKWDIGPAFDWERVIKGVKATTFERKTPLEKALEKAQADFDKAKTDLEAAQEAFNTAKQNLELAKNAVKGNGDPTVVERRIMRMPKMNLNPSISPDNPSNFAQGDFFGADEYQGDGPEKEYNPLDFE